MVFTRNIECLRNLGHRAGYDEQLFTIVGFGKFVTKLRTDNREYGLTPVFSTLRFI
jgi:hypothetical protein